MILTLSLILYLIVAFFQIRNFIKYKKTNGANFVRICLFLMNCFLIAHNVRLMFGLREGYFFASLSVAWFALQFQDWVYALILRVKEKLK